jgi:hypothetical protein
MDIHQLIAAIVPDVFCDVKARREVKSILSESPRRKDGFCYLKAAENAQFLEPNQITSGSTLRNSFTPIRCSMSGMNINREPTENVTPGIRTPARRELGLRCRQ